MRKEIDYAFRRDLAEIGNGTQFLHGSLSTGIQSSEPCRQRSSSHHPDIANSQSVDQPLKPCMLGAFHSGNKILRGLFSHPLHMQQILFPKGVQIRRRRDQAFFQQSVYHLRPQSFDVHRILGSKMFDSAGKLCGACTVGTPSCGTFIRIIKNRFAAGRAIFRHFKLRKCSTAKFRVCLDDLRNDISRFLYADNVADPDIPFADKLQVVERCFRDRCSGKTDRFQNRCRGQNPRSSHCDRDIRKFGLFSLGRKFVSNRPFRGIGPFSERTSVEKFVNFDNNSVNIIRQRITQFS